MKLKLIEILTYDILLLRKFPNLRCIIILVINVCYFIQDRITVNDTYI